MALNTLSNRPNMGVRAGVVLPGHRPSAAKAVAMAPPTLPLLADITRVPCRRRWSSFAQLRQRRGPHVRQPRIRFRPRPQIVALPSKIHLRILFDRFLGTVEINIKYSYSLPFGTPIFIFFCNAKPLYFRINEYSGNLKIHEKNTSSCEITV